MTQPIQLQKAKLGKLEKLDEGGQGTVYRIDGRPGVLYKEYLSNTQPYVPALARVAAAAAALSDSERRWLSQRAAMPRELVYDNGICVGFVMTEAPDAFWATIGGKRALRELQYLIFPPKRMWSDLALLSTEGRMAFLRETARLFAMLHRLNLVIGDVSMRNLLWACDTEPSVFLLDCDGMRLAGELPAVPAAETLDWEDPSLGSDPPNLSSDRYKLALIVQRVLTVRPQARPDDPPGNAVPDPAVPASVWSLLSRVSSTGSEPRPTAEDWRTALEGRQRIALPRLPAPSKPPRSIQPAQRPVIRLERN